MGRTIYSRSLCILYMHRENEWHYSLLCLLRQLSSVEINTSQKYIFRESITVLWEKWLIKNFHLFHILIAVSLLSSPTVPSHTPSFAFSLPPSTPSSQFRKGTDLPQGLQQSMAYQEAGSSSFTCIKAEWGNKAWGRGSQSQLQHQGHVLLPLLGAPQTEQAIQLLHTLREGQGRSHAGCVAVVKESTSSNEFRPKSVIKTFINPSGKHESKRKLKG